ncbi:MAG: hypothetical protein AAF125_15555, partial [Chloroflexota bacterium]
MGYDPQFRNSYVEGINRFQNARMRAFWEETFALVRGKSSELMSFDDIRERLRLSDESYKGLQNIDIDKIAGSVGRYRDFTANFMPRRGKMQERWSRIYAQANSMEGLPPIEVYQVGEVYFVRDGNHRVSVAHQLGMPTIEAFVTELRSPICLTPGMQRAELDNATAYAEFLAQTELNRTRPHHQSLELSEPDRYGELMELVHVHRDLLGQLEEREVPMREAASHWYDNVYRPALTLIRKYEVLEGLPRRDSDNPRTEADLFLWIVGHLYRARAQAQQAQQEHTPRYGDALADFLHEKDQPVPEQLQREDNADALITRTQLMRAMH